MAQDDMPTMRSRRLGGELRRLRLEAGLKVQQVADALECGQPKISQIENGKRGIRPLDLTTFFNLVKLEDEQHRNNLRRLAKQIHKVDWWTGDGPILDDSLRDYLTLEVDSELVRNYESDLIPGVLQTESYMREIFSTNERPEMVDHLVDTRLKRQELLEDVNGFRFRTVIDAPALHRIAGGADVVREQLSHLIDVGKKSNVTIQVLPLDAALPMDQHVPYSILSQRGDPPVDIAWLEHLTGGTLLEQRSQVQVYAGFWDELTAAAMSPSASQRYMRDLIKERG
ncbi:helix-turn-helix transcriptional regulator [Streptomyces sp. NPDC049954]|uniref:helix-turn-helix domain-containing protein n=1 Tax=Streptomyces sp. NPDC049954 TaxID=3155779 RepID=UPI003429EFA1